MYQQILIVDDDGELCGELANILRDEGFLVDIASDGLQGYAYIERNNYDLILLDFKMPGLNGIELLEKIKEKNATSRVFLVSGRPFLDKLVDDNKLSHLVNAIFSKPFNIEQLLAKIKEVV